MKDRKKALVSAVLCSVCALIWTSLCLMNASKLAGTPVLAMMICAAVASAAGAIGWFIRYSRPE